MRQSRSNRKHKLYIDLFKKDFSEYLEIIDQLEVQNDLFLDLIEDYYYCKERFKIIEKRKEEGKLKQFKDELDSLREEIITTLLD